MSYNFVVLPRIAILGFTWFDTIFAVRAKSIPGYFKSY